jgi:phage shock protein A
MKTFARIRTTVTANLESFVNDLENHEAVAMATARNLEGEVARLRLHRKRAERRAENARERIVTLEETARTWRDRAARIRDDRERALECVRRFRGAKRTILAVIADLSEEERLIEKLALDEGTLSAQVDALKRKCASLASRQTRSEVARDLDAHDGAMAVFDRWEARVETKEAAIVTDEITRDAFGGAFDQEEDRAALERELDEICRSEVHS